MCTDCQITIYLIPPPVTSDPFSDQQIPSAGNEQPETTGRRLYYSLTMIMLYIIMPGIYNYSSYVTHPNVYNYVYFMTQLSFNLYTLRYSKWFQTTSFHFKDIIK